MELENMFRRKNTFDDFKEGLCALSDVARTKKVEIRITIGREGTEVNVEPWQPYQPTCPYAHGRCNEEDDGK